MLYENLVYDDLVKEKLQQLNTLKFELEDIKSSINQKLKKNLVLTNMNSKLLDQINKIDDRLNNIINCMKQYTSEIDILNNNIITNDIDVNKNVYIRKINEIIENDL